MGFGSSAPPAAQLRTLGCANPCSHRLLPTSLFPSNLIHRGWALSAHGCFSGHSRAFRGTKLTGVTRAIRGPGLTGRASNRPWALGSNGTRITSIFEQSATQPNKPMNRSVNSLIHLTLGAVWRHTVSLRSGPVSAVATRLLPIRYAATAVGKRVGEMAILGLSYGL